MARPSLKTEKTEHILHAYEHCIAKYGVEGATLQKVAEEAGMARPLLRHYVGNREELLNHSIARYFARQQQQLTHFEHIHTGKQLVDILFDTKHMTDTNDIMIASAFTLAADQHPAIKTQMKAWFAEILTAFQHTLARLHPKTNQDQINTVAVGIIGVYFNLYAMQPIDDSANFTQSSKAAATLLLAGLPQ